MYKLILSALLMLASLSPAGASTVIYDENNFGGAFTGQDLGVLQVGQSIVRGSTDGTCLTGFLGSVTCDASVATEAIQDTFEFSVAPQTVLRSVQVTAGGFGPSTLLTTYRLDLPAVPIFDASGQQITSDLPVYITSLTIGQSAELLENPVFIFDAADPGNAVSGPADLSFSVFSGNSADPGRFGVQWQVTLDVAAVPLSGSLSLLLVGLGALGVVSRWSRAV